jgi:hypothetical protein
VKLVYRLSFTAALLAGSFVALVSAPGVSAQDATPAATECVVTTPEENVALVTSYIQAYDAADAAGIDQTLADAYADNIDRGSQPNDPASNDDEAALAAALEATYPNSTYTINEIAPLGDNRVVADVTINITDVAAADGTPTTLAAAINVDSISIITIECGEIASARTVSDGLSLVLGLGFTLSPPAAEATPVS